MTTKMMFRWWYSNLKDENGVIANHGMTVARKVSLAMAFFFKCIKHLFTEDGSNVKGQTVWVPGRALQP